MTASADLGAADEPRSVFADIDVCREAGLALPDAAPRPNFEEDFWDFTQVIGLPNQMAKVSRRFDFTAIVNAGWRLVAKEQLVAMLAPRHDAVALLPRGYRTPLHLATASRRLAELTRFLNWLTNQGVTRLADIDSERCEAYLAHRRYLHDENDVVVGERSPATRRGAAQTVVDLVNHRDLFTTDRVTADLRPWGGAAPSAIAEMPCGIGQNKTPQVNDGVLQPMLAAAGYLVSMLGPHAIDLLAQIRSTDQLSSFRSGRHTAVSRVPTTEFMLLAELERDGHPLPLLPEHNVAVRHAAGWSADDPLTPIALGQLARQAGITQFHHRWIPQLRGQIEATLRVVGAQKPFARDAVNVDRRDEQGTIAWTVPLDRAQAVALVGIVRTAAIITVAAVCGMRSSELMELQVGCCPAPEDLDPGLVRYRLASKIVKGQPLGGLADEWVVIEPVYRAAQLLRPRHFSAPSAQPARSRRLDSRPTKREHAASWTKSTRHNHPSRGPTDMRISATQRAQNETRIRAAMERLLHGQIPPVSSSRCVRSTKPPGDGTGTP